MKIRRFPLLGGATAVAALAAAVPALAGSPAVSVRVEGVNRTLLPATVVHGDAGPVTKGGTPAGTCPGSSGAGDLDAATHHHWAGTYSTGLGIEIEAILGETHKYSPHGYYWGIWVNSRFASAGICDLKLHAGDQLLFAPVPAKGSTYPIVLSAPGRATAGRAFTVKASYFGAKGAAKPLSGVTITGAGVTNAQGVATVTAPEAGKLKLVASRKGDIRAEATVAVSG
ncbi:MAG TPA: hypothetical protein VIK04_17915 [Solirubrobacteraceae bacterium]